MFQPDGLKSSEPLINARRHDGARPLQLFNGDYHYRGWDEVPESAPKPVDVLRHLLARGAYYDINTAAAMGDLDRVRTLVDDDPSLANRNAEYVTYYLGSGTPLRNAAARGHLDIVRLLLDRGADPNLPEPGIAPRGAALYSAACGGHVEVARLLLEHGAFPNPPFESSADALTMAGKNQPMVDLLCSYGAHRSVDILAYYGDLETAAAVFAVNPALADKPDALACAAGEGHEAFVRLMLRHRPGLITRDASNLPSVPPWATPMAWATRRGHQDVVDLLTEP